jgi:hypothetical protein
MSSYYFVGQTIAGTTSGSGGFLALSGTAASPTYSFAAAPGTGWYYDTVNSSLAATVSGVEAVQITGGANPSLLIGPVSTGVSLINAGTNLLNMSGNFTATGSFTSAQTSALYPTYRVGGNSLSGMGTTAATSLILFANGVQTLVLDSSQNAVFSSTVKYKAATANKATSYTVLAADSATTFDNTGAGGTVVTFTLPAAAVGLTFTFNDVLTTAASGIVVTPQGGDTIAYTTKTAGQSITSPVAARGSVTLTCTAANTWAVVSIIGTFT